MKSERIKHKCNPKKINYKAVSVITFTAFFKTKIMSAVREKVINLVIPVNEQEALLTTALESGFVLGAELHTNHNNIDNLAEYGIFDDSGVAFSKSSHIDHWKRREGGAFEDSYKPLLFNTESKTFTFKVKTKNRVDKETYFHLILMYKINQECA